MKALPEAYLLDNARAHARTRAQLDELARQEPYLNKHVIEDVFYVNLTDNTAADLFTVETYAGAFSGGDGGAYTVRAEVLVSHGASSNNTNAAAKSLVAHYARVMRGDGIGTSSAVSEISETASAANTPATRDIGTVTITLTETTEYSVKARITADFTGTGVTTGLALVFVRLIWYGFNEPPVLSGSHV